MLYVTLSKDLTSNITFIIKTNEIIVYIMNLNNLHDWAKLDDWNWVHAAGC